MKYGFTCITAATFLLSCARSSTLAAQSSAVTLSAGAAYANLYGGVGVTVTGAADVRVVHHDAAALGVGVSGWYASAGMGHNPMLDNRHMSGVGADLVFMLAPPRHIGMSAAIGVEHLHSMVPSYATTESVRAGAPDDPDAVQQGVSSGRGEKLELAAVVPVGPQVDVRLSGTKIHQQLYAGASDWLTLLGLSVVVRP